jgi:hypothetical protein
MSRGVDGLHSLGLEKRTDGVLRLRAARLPVIAAKLVPSGRKADLIGVGILNDQPFEPLRMPTDDAKADRTTVVLNVKAKSRETDLGQEFFKD